MQGGASPATSRDPPFLPSGLVFLCVPLTSSRCKAASAAEGKGSGTGAGSSHLMKGKANERDENRARLEILRHPRAARWLARDGRLKSDLLRGSESSGHLLLEAALR